MPPPLTPFQDGDHVVDHMDDALHGLLSPADAQYVMTHAVDCPICSVALKEARRRIDALNSLAPVEVAPALLKGIAQRVEMLATGYSRRQRLIRKWTLIGVAAVLLVMLSTHIWFSVQSPGAYDLRLLGQQRMLAGAPASLRVQLMRDQTPVAGAGITLALYSRESGQTAELTRYQTDAAGSGSPLFTLPDWPDGTYTLRAVASTSFHTETLEQEITLRRDARLMLSTDKPVYQPGQTIHVRALALRRPDLKPVAGQEATFTLLDPKGTLIFKQAGVTSAYGITSADCPLATEIIQGVYTVQCKIGATESSASVEIKTYTLPKFKIALSADKPFYAPGERVRVAVQADYFFNQPVAGARVSVDAGFRTLTATTDARGHADLELVLPPSLPGTPQENGDARLGLTATVVDTANQEQSRSLPVVVTTSPIHIEVVPESGRLVSGLANRIYVLTTYADGRPAKTRLAVAGLVPQETSALGAAMFELTPQSDQLTLALQATDDAGVTSARRVELATSASEGIAASDDYIVRTDRATYHTGQALAIDVLGGGDGPVFVDLIKDGQTMRTATVQVAAGRGSAVIDLSPELAGTLQLNAYRFGTEGVAVHKTRLVYVQAADDLHVQVSADKGTYRPGETAHLSFRLMDAGGKPLPGALSLAAVDEAVFNVLDGHPGLEKTFFTLDQQLLEPMYQIYPAGPHFDDTTPDDRLLNQALFSNVTKTTARVRQFLLARGAFSLEASTGPENRERAALLAQQRLELLPYLWFGTVVVIGLTLIAVYARRAFFWVIGALILGGCFWSTLIPQFTNASNDARNNSAASLAQMEASLSALQSLQMRAEFTDLASRTSANGPESSPRLRQFFPETLLWRPELITDDHGNATLDLPLADSITSWRLSTSAVTANGQLGAAETPIRVFQPFFIDLNLPSTLTRGDEISVPAIVYNYLQTPQTVTLTLPRQDFFEPLDGESRQVELAAGQVRSVYFRIRVLKAGSFHLQLSARAGDVADALQRDIEVLPGGQSVEFTFSGTLSGQAVNLPLNLPANIIDGSLHAQVKFYPSTFSQVVEGLDNIFQMPSGCFEQTSSTTYPNVLALHYLQSTQTAAPATQAKASQYIHLGYQRLLTFEIPGGGFDWFGRPAAHPTLSAYGLQEFQDMAQVHTVDPKLIERTRAWLLAQQNADGSWTPGRQFYHDDPTALGDARLSTSAYIAWSVFANQPASAQAAAATRYLHANAAAAKANPYTTAMVSLALLSMDRNDVYAVDLLSSLEAQRQLSSDGKLTHWSATNVTAFNGEGSSSDVETTALAALALLQSPAHTVTGHAALSWLVANKDAQGTWHSTQATVLALKALLAGTATAAGDNQEHRMSVQVGAAAQEVRIAADQSDVLKSVDISALLQSGSTSVQLTNRTAGEIAYQVRVRLNVPGNPPAAPRPDLDISLDYNRTRLALGESLPVVATLRNNTAEAMPMILADLPIPPGFAAETAALDRLEAQGVIEKYQLTSRQVIIYLRSLDAHAALEIPYTLHAVIPVAVASPPAIVYAYYKPETRAATAPVKLEIVP